MTATGLQESEAPPESMSFRQADIDEGFVRISKLAVLALLVSLFCPLALIAVRLLPVCVVAVILGLVAWIRIQRNATLGGARLAQIAVVVGLLLGFWSVTAARQRATYLYDVAGRHAQRYLQVLSAGHIYQALELQKFEPQRQIAGTNLAEAYSSSENESSEVEEFRKNAATKVVLDSGPAANWQFAAGEGIEDDGSLTRVTVRMANAADSDSQAVLLTLARMDGVVAEENGPPTALWCVVEEKLAGPR